MIFIVVDSGIIVAPNSAYGSATAVGSVEGKMRFPSSDIEGTIIAAKEITTQGKFPIRYSADFSEYAKKEDGMLYKVYFSLTTKEGNKYITSYNPIATFSFSKGGSSVSNGDEILVPLFE